MEFEKIQKIIADVLNIEPEKITMESAFVDDLNADSLDVLQIVMGIEDEFDIKIPDEATGMPHTIPCQTLLLYIFYIPFV